MPRPSAAKFGILTRSSLDAWRFREHVGLMKVLVAYDFSDASLEALEQGRVEARAIGGTLAFCHVMPVMYDAEPFLSQFRQDATLDLSATEAKVRRAIEDKAHSVLGSQAAEVFVDTGIPYAEIVRRAEAWGADLVVVGSHGRSGIARVLLGSVAERVVRHAQTSVLVARPVKKAGVVLAATDLSEASLPVIGAAARAAERRNGRLVVVTAVDWAFAAWGSLAGAPFGATTVVPPIEVQEEVRSAMRATIEKEIERVGAKGEALVIDGTPVSAIADKAEELSAELVVVGTHGRTGLSRLTLGSVAERVVRAAECSVLVVRAKDAATTGAQV
jgi:nucleotide-binding universal stress UspA family protein